VNIIRLSQGTDVYTIVLHFDTLEHLQGWLASETSRRLMDQIEPLLASDACVDIKTGLEFWFTPAHASAEASTAVQAFPPHALGHFSADGARALGAPAAVSGGTPSRVADREHPGNLSDHRGLSDVCDHAALHPPAGGMALPVGGGVPPWARGRTMRKSAGPKTRQRGLGPPVRIRWHEPRQVPHIHRLPIGNPRHNCRSVYGW
jgi:hypothetical protein